MWLKFHKFKMSISTGLGDSGKTRNLSGNKMDKCCSHIIALGTIDELSSQIGVVLTFELDDKTWNSLEKIQKTLFKLGADLSTNAFTKQKRIEEEDIDYIKKQISDLENKLPKLTKFVLPGGSPGAASLHIARTICRRAESQLVQYNYEKEINPKLLAYINKLSDLLFLLALWENKEMGIREKLVGLDENLTPFLD